MGFTRTLRAVGGVVVAGALLLTAAPTASADYIRDGQWALDAFNPQKVWKESTGKNVIVAVIDSGVDGGHADLKGNVLPGKSFDGGGGTADHETVEDHGTAMAALIAAHGHGPGNADGIMGLAPDAKILPIKMSEAIGGDQNNIDGPLRYAVDHGAKVINMSFVTPRLTQQETDAINYAVKKDVLLVGGSGNEGSGKPLYPAGAPGVLAVGAVAKDGKVLGESNYGPHIRLIAPGEKIYSAGTPPKGYRQGTGTSDSTAYVSAAAALVRSKYPDLTAGQVANRLTRTAITPDGKTDIKSPDPKYGYGVIRPYRALSEHIPAGSKNGPLTMPKDTESSADGGTDVPGGNPSASSGDAGIGVSPLAIAGIAVGVIVALGIVIALIVTNSKRRNGPPPGGTGFGGPSGGAGVPPQYPYGSYQQPGGPGGYQSAPHNYPPRQ
ncbi:S8 family serine peptidase [Streptomyces caniferus]|uniref:S8 family serine peptidase n=1 Tax=Streptomyces caniferus TaxID=285557 RepID=UPI00370FBF7D